MDKDLLLFLTADIVAAHVSKNTVETAAVPQLISSVYGAMAAAVVEPTLIEEKRQPAVAIRSSIKADSIACLECGAQMKMLKRHLSTDHDLSPEEYRARWKLPWAYPLVAPNYAQRRKELAHQIGLGRLPSHGKGRQDIDKEEQAQAAIPS